MFNMENAQESEHGWPTSQAGAGELPSMGSCWLFSGGLLEALGCNSFPVFLLRSKVRATLLRKPIDFPVGKSRLLCPVFTGPGQRHLSTDWGSWQRSCPFHYQVKQRLLSAYSLGFASNTQVSQQKAFPWLEFLRTCVMHPTYLHEGFKNGHRKVISISQYPP